MLLRRAAPATITSSRSLSSPVTLISIPDRSFACLCAQRNPQNKILGFDQSIRPFTISHSYSGSDLIRHRFACLRETLLYKGADDRQCITAEGGIDRRIAGLRREKGGTSLNDCTQEVERIA